MRTQRLIRIGLAVVVGITILVLPRTLTAQYVPFKVQINGGLCDSGPSPSSNPSITIDGDSTFVVTSILIKRGPMNPVDFMFLSVNTVSIDGTSFDTRTGNLFGPIAGEFA